MPSLKTLVSRPLPLFTLATLLRLALLLYGLWQDAHSPVKYTDIDYLVFTDAARFVARGGSPYDRETYRYTPLLAWMLVPTAWGGRWFEFGKVVFAAADLVAGWLLIRILSLADGGRRRRTRTTITKGGGGGGGGDARGETDEKAATGGGEGVMSSQSAHLFGAIWLLNPMVATISTRGSSEGLLGVLTAGLLYAVLKKRIALAGIILGVGVHFKIYPFIWAPAILWWMDRERLGHGPGPIHAGFVSRALGFVSRERIMFAVISFATFMGLNALMFSLYVFAPRHFPVPPHRTNAVLLT
jgi:GPI mannosyltransferase 1 subunit M